MKTSTYSLYLIYSNCRYNRTVVTSFPQLIHDCFDTAMLDPNFRCGYLYRDGQYLKDLSEIEAMPSAATSSTDILRGTDILKVAAGSVHSCGITEADVMKWIEESDVDYTIVRKE